LGTAEKPAEHQFKPGEKIKVNLHGRIVDAVIRAVVNYTDGLKLQVDYGNDETALIATWQVMKD
jgi:hypothetical protein